MTTEMHALEENRAWSIKPLPLSKRPNGYKWVYKIKQWPNMIIEYYKAQLVAKGFTQL